MIFEGLVIVDSYIVEEVLFSARVTALRKVDVRRKAVNYPKYEWYFFRKRVYQLVI